MMIDSGWTRLRPIKLSGEALGIKLGEAVVEQSHAAVNLDAGARDEVGGPGAQECDDSRLRRINNMSTRGSRGTDILA